ncbi:DUF6152 family protein [Candidatus Rariloculus sp.]|uniref:DUF6152 family protein n=1 Tax=Candidatus Rariloculus sp. TaxID=3101265 RepID=UPI003D0B4597
MNIKTALLCLAAFGAGSAFAHHSVAVNFDQSSEITIEGRLTVVAWRNPHSHLRLNVADAGGAEWLVEFGAINTMKRSGFQTDRFLAGDLISVTGWPGHRDRTMYFLEATLEDGTRLVCAGASCAQER